MNDNINDKVNAKNIDAAESCEASGLNFLSLSGDKQDGRSIEDIQKQMTDLAPHIEAAQKRIADITARLELAQKKC